MQKFSDIISIVGYVTGSFFTHSEGIFTDDTKRTKTNSFSLGSSNVKCVWQVISTEEKISISFDYVGGLWKGFVDISYKNLAGVGDIFYYEGKSYKIRSWDIYDNVNELGNHIEFVAELLPTNPNGVS